MRVTLWTTLIMALGAVALGGHGQAPHPVADPRVFSPWDQATLFFLAFAAALYWRGATRLASRGARSMRAEYVAFSVGWLALVTSVSPWIDRAAIERFSAHMTQHELMMLVGAPLLIAGRPLSVWLLAVPGRWRSGVVRPLQQPVVARGIRILNAPVLVWALHGIVLWVWHIPLLYDSAVQNEGVHALQHGMFVGTSLLFWSGLVYGRYGRAGYGAAVFFVFTTAVHTGILGALFTVWRTPLYSAYAAVPGISTEAALSDQQLAGLVMWIPAGILLTFVGVALFAAWLGEAERRSRQSARWTA